MIHRERPGRPPKTLEREARAGLTVLREHSRLAGRSKVQRRWPFDVEIVRRPAVVRALLSLFDHKCAYCESPVAVDDAVTGWHRPPEEAMQLGGMVARDHYWWLAYEWENLYLVCPNCHSHKGNRFPVLGHRAEPEARGPALVVELPLLLDPCRDRPERLLGYAADGTVLGTDQRSETTIDVLGLNRTDLVASRSLALQETNEAASRALEAPGNAGTAPKRLAALVADGQPYAGIRRWGLRRLLVQRGAPSSLLQSLGLADREALARATETSAWVSAGPDVGTLVNVKLERIEIANFKAIQRLSLSFRDPLPDNEPWLLLLGENGVGKSTLLKAIALAVVDEPTRRRLVPDASTCVRRGSERGHVRLSFSEGEDVELSFSRGQEEFRQVGESPPIVVLGYGPTRLPPPPDYTPGPQARADVENLFNPFAPLSDAEKWLANVDQVPPGRFNLHATDLKSLLPMTDEDRLLRRSGRLLATSGGSTSPVPDLSDGYRSVIAMATDMMMNLAPYWESMSTAEGLLLVDELEVHLHPQWRMTIVSVLRRVFPRLRVVATTHDPLCLQQTEPGEVVVLRRQGRTGIQALPRDVPKGLRADQLLTGDWFGLSTTTDIETARLMEEHSQLLLEPRTRQAVTRRRQLEGTLRDRVGQFAETSIERMAQDVAAKLAREEAVDLGKAGHHEREELAASVIAAVRRKRGAPR